MAAYLSTELGGSANQTAAPTGYRPKATVYGARVKRLRASFTLNAQATSDTLVVGNRPPGSVFAGIELTSSASLATSTLAIGTAANTGKYRPAAVFTTADTPTLVGTAALLAESDAGLAAEEQIICTIAVASLPASGTLVVDFYYSMPN